MCQALAADDVQARSEVRLGKESAAVTETGIVTTTVTRSVLETILEIGEIAIDEVHAMTETMTSIVVVGPDPEAAVGVAIGAGIVIVSVLEAGVAHR